MLIIPERNRVFISFFVFGLLNNILYVIILSAAIDLVGSSTPKAVVLLADVVPSFALKVTAPLYVSLIPYHVRLWSLVALSSVGMLFISLSGQDSTAIKVGGIMMASLSSGLGEVTFLQLTHYFDEDCSIGGFSSGTGGAGLFGSFLFMLTTNVLGMQVWLVLFIFSVLPLGFLAIFYGFLPSHHLPNALPQYQPLETSANNVPESFASGQAGFKAHVVATFEKVRPLIVPYMLPLSSVYISEYVINQGISPTLLFPLDELPSRLFSSYRDIYVVYGFLYQLGVFVSRSSVNFGIRIRQLYWLSGLQFVNVLITLAQSLWDLPFPSIWPLLLLIFYEGLLGGFSYVNTFMSVSEDVPKGQREFSIGAVSISDSFGIVAAGCINWWLESRLCGLQVDRGRDWCQTGHS